MLSFDEVGLISELQKSAPRSRTAFAAACAERLFPAYVAFSKTAGRGDAQTIGELLERIWRRLAGEPIDDTGLQADLDRCMALVPGEDEEPWTDDQPYADDAASAVAYTLRTLQTGDAQEAAWAARRAYDALDHHVTHRLGIDEETRIGGHPSIQAELARQRRDLDELCAAGDSASAAITRVRDRARAEASSFFGPPS